MRLKSPRVFTAGVVLGWCVSAATAGTAQEPPARFQLSPGVVVDRGAEQIYAMEGGPERGIVALAANTGETVWRSEAAVRPVALTADQRLITLDAADQQDNRGVAVVSLDARTGAAQSRIPLDLPAPVGSPVDSPTGELRVAVV